MKFAVNASIMFIFHKDPGKRRKTNYYSNLFAVVLFLGSQAPVVFPESV